MRAYGSLIRVIHTLYEYARSRSSSAGAYTPYPLTIGTRTDLVVL